METNDQGIVMDAGAVALMSASKGFDDLFSNRLADARTHFGTEATPFHLLGQGTCAFLEAALGMEVRSLFGCQYQHLANWKSSRGTC